MTILKRLAGLATALAVLSLVVPLSAGPKAGDGERVNQVESKYVCFINKQHFDKPQAAVTVEGRLYYGCCENCLPTLATDPKSRVDVDPVSGNQVDKATAVVGVDKAGRVYFFENIRSGRNLRFQELRCG